MSKCGKRFSQQISDYFISDVQWRKSFEEKKGTATIKFSMSLQTFYKRQSFRGFLQSVTAGHKYVRESTTIALLLRICPLKHVKLNTISHDTFTYISSITRAVSESRRRWQKMERLSNL